MRLVTPWSRSRQMPPTGDPGADNRGGARLEPLAGSRVLAELGHQRPQLRQLLVQARPAAARGGQALLALGNTFGSQL